MKNSAKLKILTAAKIILSAVYISVPLIKWLTLGYNKAIDFSSILTDVTHPLSLFVLFVMYMLSSPGYICGMAILFMLRAKVTGHQFGKAQKTALVFGAVGVIGQIIQVILDSGSIAVASFVLAAIATFPTVILTFIYFYKIKRPSRGRKDQALKEHE